MSPDRGRLVVLSGPSGVGKTTVCTRLRERLGIERILTATTRSPRSGEADGIDYRFLSPEGFEAGIREGRFLEWAEVFGNRYGTPKGEVDRILDRGRPALLAIDVQGAVQIRERVPDALLLFLAPPDREALAERLAARGTDDPATRERRLAEAERELAERDRFDHVIVNDDLDRAVEAIGRILENAGMTRREEGEGDGGGG